ncbi:MAG: toll/interleukin-1 receptor domain-containing protein, partial [Scytonema sp. PMC 1069.18]|nr:toll/interleukin-1 receptor domain-containing protein [Scytonema sp. PMC 1069.18]
MTKPTLNLFISYSSDNSIQVDKIASDIRRLRHTDGTPRYTTWQDKHNLVPGSPHWWDSIVDAIEKCDVFVFHISQASLQSYVCLAELDYAHKLNLPIIPVVLDGEFFLNPTKGKYDITYWNLLPKWLMTTQFLFYTGTEFFDLFQHAINGFEKNWPRRLKPKRPNDPGEEGNNHKRYVTA